MKGFLKFNHLLKDIFKKKQTEGKKKTDLDSKRTILTMTM